MADTTNFQSTYRPASLSQEHTQPEPNGRILSLSRLYSHQLRFVPARGWFLYNGTRWILDETNQVLSHIPIRHLKGAKYRFYRFV